MINLQQFKNQLDRPQTHHHLNLKVANFAPTHAETPCKIGEHTHVQTHLAQTRHLSPAILNGKKKLKPSLNRGGFFHNLGYKIY
jgi:hypothetical protein